MNTLTHTTSPSCPYDVVLTRGKCKSVTAVETGLTGSFVFSCCSSVYCRASWSMLGEVLTSGHLVWTTYTEKMVRKGLERERKRKVSCALSQFSQSKKKKKKKSFKVNQFTWRSFSHWTSLSTFPEFNFIKLSSVTCSVTKNKTNSLSNLWADFCTSNILWECP